MLIYFIIAFNLCLVIRGRKRRKSSTFHKRYIKKKVECGDARTTKVGQEIQKKMFMSQMACKCSRACSSKIDLIHKKTLFDTYYQKFNWGQKTLFIRSNVKMKTVRSNRANLFAILAEKQRDITCEYSLVDDGGVTHPVCREFFINCLQISPSRIYTTLKTLQSNPSDIERAHTLQQTKRQIKTFWLSNNL